MISLDVRNRRLDLLVSRRRNGAPARCMDKASDRYQRGYMALYAERVTQAHEGCDFDFLDGTAPTPEPEIH